MDDARKMMLKGFNVTTLSVTRVKELNIQFIDEKRDLKDEFIDSDLTKSLAMLLASIANLRRSSLSGVTPIGQGWTNARGLRGLGGPKPGRKIQL